MENRPRLQAARTRPRLLHMALLGLAAGEEPSTRRRVFRLVQEHPGLHQREIARQLDLRPSHAEYHLHQLSKAGLLKAEDQGGYRRYFLTVQPPEVPEGAVPPADRPWLSLLRQPRPLEICAHLLQEGPMEMGPLSDAVGIAASTLSYHVDKLEEQGVVARYREGNQRYLKLQDRDRLVRILLQHEPPDDLVAGFEELWDDIGL